MSLVWAQAAQADNSLVVVSTNNGRGLYSYTFSRGIASYFWGVPGTGVILIQSYGILQTSQPPGWSVSIDTNSLVTWQHTNGIGYLDLPVTFSILSSYPVPKTYDGIISSPFSVGFLLGGVYSAHDGNALGGGFTEFIFTGPDPNPIPTLSVQRAGTNIVISWPAAITGFTLESCVNLSASPVWTTVTNAAVTVGDQTCVTNALLDGAMFFRAGKPAN